MTLEEILLLSFAGLMLLFLVFRRFKTNNSSKQKELKETEKERKQRSIEAIMSKDKGKNKLIDYSRYKMNTAEIVSTLIVVSVVIFGITHLFYDSIIFSSISCILSLFFLKPRAKQLRDKRKHTLMMQFKEAASSLASSLAAGQSVENAFRDTIRDLRMLFPDKDAYIIREFQVINRRIENGENVERAFDDFANRSDVEDIKNFSDVFITCKKSGGDIVEVIKRTVDVINTKVEIQNDIKVLVSQKKLEGKIITIIPFMIVAFLKYSSGDFVAPLYGFPGAGPIVMTFALCMVLLSNYISSKLMDIKM